MISEIFLTSLFDSWILAESSGSIIDYFINSNLAGKLIVLLLLLISLITWTTMIGKYLELNKMDQYNKAFEDRVMSGGSVLYGQQKPLPHIPYSALFHDALAAYHQMGEVPEGQDVSSANKLRIGHMENALHRVVSRKAAGYETKMVFLASIVTGAPFLGLLGTVWGVMDAFGSVGLQANVTLQMLAPGVSGALLTTVAGLLVAIPSVFGYNFLLTKTRSMITDLENFASHLADRIELEQEQSYGEDV